eukprot:gene16066-17689_t
MDFSKFSDENFEVKEWINNALKAHKDAGVSVDEVNKSLEETSQIAINNLPRVLREVEGIKSEAVALKEQMKMVKDDIKKVDENTSQSMKILVEIDNVKERMQAASKALQEADNWTTLSSDVDNIFEAGNVDEIAEKLIGMQKSLVVLEDVPDFAERRRFLESLKNKLEALLSTKLVMAFNSHNLDAARRYVEIFTEIGRLAQLQTYYNNCHRGKLIKIWNELREDPTTGVASWLPKFYDNLISLWHEEIAWCGQVFPDPVAILSSLLVQTLLHLEPSISQCLTESLSGEDASLSLLIQIKQISYRFISSLQSATKALSDLLSLFEDLLPLKQDLLFLGEYLLFVSEHRLLLFEDLLSLNQDHRSLCEDHLSLCEDLFFVSEAGSTSPQTLTDLIRVIEEPYLLHRLRYSELQQAEMMEGIDRMQLEVTSFSETVANISESVGQAFRMGNEAKDNCFHFTDGYGTLGLTRALETFFSAYLGKVDCLITEMRKACDHEGNSKQPNSNFDAEDEWANFQNAFKIIEICGQLLIKIIDFRENLTKEIKDKLESILECSENSSFAENYLKTCRPVEFDELREFQERINSYGVNVVLSSTHDQIERLNEHAHKFAFTVIFSHLKRQLDEIPNLSVWSSVANASEAITDDLPTFSLSPQGCITQVGDYLLTLPQQLESFFTNENPALVIALKAGQIPYTDKQDDSDVEHDHYWVMGFARGTMILFIENILKIKELSTDHSIQQLLADIDYLCNIFEAVEIHPNDQLNAIKELLVVESSRFHERAAEISADSRIENNIARMRGI